MSTLLHSFQTESSGSMTNQFHNHKLKAKSHQNRKAGRICILAAIAALSLPAITAFHARGATDETATWNLDANGNWNAAADWSTSPDSTATFPDNGGGYAYNVVITPSSPLTVDLQGLTSPTTIGSLTLDSGNNIVNSAGTNQTLIIDPTSLNTQVGSNIAGNINGSEPDGGGITLEFSSGSTVSVVSTVSGDLLGNVSLTVNESGGTVILSGSGNTYTGATTISGGTLSLQGGSIADSSGVSVASGATLDISSNGGGATINNLTGTGTGYVTLGGNGLTVDATGTNSDSFTGVISGSGGSLTKTGTGTLTLSGDNTYTGGTAINGGILAISNDNNINGGAGGITFGGGTLQLNNDTSSLNFSGQAVQLGVATGDTSTLEGTISDGSTPGSGSLTYEGPGKLILTSTNNTYTGGTVIDGGTLSISTDSNLGTGGIAFGGGTLQTTGTVTDTQTIALNTGGGTIDTDGQTDSFSGNITGTGGLTVTDSSGTGGGIVTLSGDNTYSGVTAINGGTLAISNNDNINNGPGGITFGGGTLQLNNYTSNLNFSDQAVQLGVASGDTSTLAGTITNGVGTGSLTYEGPGTLTLAGDNTYTGGTTINGGILSISAEDNLGTGGIAFDGGTLQTSGTVRESQAVTLNTSGGTIDTDGNTDAFSGVFSGTGDLTVTDSSGTGDGILTLSAVNTYSGVTAINGGTLAISNDDNINYGSGGITFGGGTLQLNNDTSSLNFSGQAVQLGVATGDTSTLEGTISDGTNPGSLTYEGPGTLILAGTNTYTGGTTINGGTLSISAEDNLGALTGGITFDGGTLQTTAAITDSRTITVGAAGGTLDSDGVSDTFSGVISSTGSPTGALTLTSSSTSAVGTIILSGTNTYTNNTDITATGTEQGVTVVAGTAAAFGSSIVNLTNTSTYSSTTSGVTTKAATTLETNTYYNDIVQGNASITTPLAVNLNGYSQDANSTLDLAAFVATTPTRALTYDSLAVASEGTVSLNGTLKLAVVNSTVTNYGQLQDFDTLNVITSSNTPTGATGSGGSTPTTTGATPIETGGSTYGTGFSTIAVTALNAATTMNYYETNTSSGEVVTIQTLFAPDATNPNAMALADYLDNNFISLINVQSGVKNALGALSSLSSAQISQVLNQMTPAAYSSLTDASIQSSIFTSQQLFSQISNSFTNPGFNFSGLSLLQTNQQDPFAQSLESSMNFTGEMAKNSVNYMDDTGDLDSPASNQVSGQWSGFAAGELVTDHLAQTNSAESGQHLLSGGVLAGVDYTLTPNLLVGGMFNWQYSGMTLDSAGSRQAAQSYSPGLFAGYNRNNTFVNAMVSYTYNDYTIDRNIDIPGAASTATGKPTGNQYDAAVQGGYLFQASPEWKIGPAVGLGYTHADIGSFTETGSPFDMNVGSQSVDSLRTLLGAQGQYTLLVTNYTQNNTKMTTPVLSVSFNAYWQHEFLNSSQSITSSINGLGNGSFVFQTGSPVRDSLLGGLGLNGNLGNGITLFANYETQIGQKSQFAQTVMVGAAVSF